MRWFRAFWVISTVMGVLLGATTLWGGTFPARNNADVNEIKRRVKAAQFLSIATFGPTLGEIEALAGRMEEIGNKEALGEWIGHQFALPATKHEDLTLAMIGDDGFDPLLESIRPNRYKHHAWWDSAISAPDQLRQRMVWALSQIFVINEFGAGFGAVRNDASGQPMYLGVVDYYDMLLDNAFGNYRQLLEDVTFHPIMGVFLSHINNLPPNQETGRYPDENYAREVMQLFSIGLYQMKKNGQYKKKKGELIETYDNETIKALARVFTGLSYASGSPFVRDYHKPMVMYKAYHDYDVKTLLNGVVLPAGQTGMEDIADALDNIFNHPNVPPFIARLLIQRIVRSNPSKAYIKRVANVFIDNGQGVRGDFKAVVRAILLDKDVFKSHVYEKLRKPYALRVTTKGTEYSRLQEPVVRFAQLLRAFHAQPSADPQEACHGRFMIPSLYYVLGQEPYDAFSVFNFYLPDYIPEGDFLTYVPSNRIPNGTLYAPEFQIFTSIAANRTANFFRWVVGLAGSTFTLLNNATHGKLTCTISLDFSREEALAADPQALMTHLDLLLCHGTLSDETKDIIATAIAEESDHPVVRSRAAILGVLTASECATSE